MGKIFTYKILFIKALCLSSICMCYGNSATLLNNSDPTTLLLSPRVAEQARYLTRDVTSDYDKSLVLFRWLAKNIDYDIDAAININDDGFHDLQKPETVLRRGKAVCQGYVQTYAAFLNAVQVKNYIIHGYARSDAHEELNEHTWIAVQLNGEWQLMEPTWAAGGVENGIYYSDYREEYFQMKPEQAIKTHMPDDPMWQFLDPFVSRTSFLSADTSAVGQKFSYKDALIQFFELAPLERQKVAIERALSFNPHNSSALYELALLRYDEAMLIENQYDKLTSNLNYHEDYIPLRDELLDLLTQEENLLIEARDIFDGLKELDQTYHKAVQENLRVLRSVSKNINFERRFLSEL